MNCPKKFDLGRSRQVGQMSKDEYEKKNPTFLFCGLLLHVPTNQWLKLDL